MAYRKWTNTSETHADYRAAADRCAALFELPALQAIADAAYAMPTRYRQDRQAKRDAVAAATTALADATRRAMTPAKRAAHDQRTAELRAELAADAAAEQAKRDAAYQRSAHRHDNLATNRQVAYIMSLQCQYVRDGDTGRIPGGHLTREAAENLTRRQASNRINLLNEEY